MEQTCCMQLDTVTRGSHCFELKQSGTCLLHANAHRYVWLTLFGVKKIGTSLSHADGQSYLLLA